MKEYKALLELFSHHLEKHISGLAQKLPKELYQPEEYILGLGGKRLRPLLALISCDLFDRDAKSALDASLSIELFHNFSLIHDDILDAAPLRRNKATVHTKWNSNIAILSGDVMLVKAFQVLENYEGDTYKQLASLFNKTAIEVCEGQQEDMNFENLQKVPVSDYLHMITLKTAVLLGCSLKMGAIIGQASEKDQEHLYQFGKHLGLSFQLLDDLLDAFAEDPEKFGKQSGGDILANKKTFLLSKAMEMAGREQMKKLEESLLMKDQKLKVQTILSLYTELDIQRLCQEEADRHTRIAIDHLNCLQVSPSKKEKLKQFSLELLNRQI